jgi:Domain of unknown function (DUF6531)
MAGASCGRLTSLVMTCNFPINLPTLTDAVDFDLPGPIPIRFERSYYSRDRYEGPWAFPLLQSMTAMPVDIEPGSCQSTGGVPYGEATPITLSTFCCQK